MYNNATSGPQVSVETEVLSDLAQVTQLESGRGVTPSSESIAETHAPDLLSLLAENVVCQPCISVGFSG